MRILATVAFLAASILSLAPLADAQAASAVSLTRNLSLGSSGPEVLALQQLLNASSATQIAASGPGSPGHETDYFGLLTEAAVIRFQNLYASSVLSPVGLTRGNGFVGPHTRAKLLALQATPATIATTETASSTPAPAVVLAPPASSSANPNLAELPYVLSAINKQQKKHNVSAQDITKLDTQITSIMSTTTDLKAAFLKQAKIKVSNSGLLGLKPPSSPRDFVTNLLIALGIVQPAYAVTGIPFGGLVSAAIPCTCDPSVWVVMLSIPLPPSYAEVLSDAPWSQLFLSHVPPHTTQYYLGYYEPGVQACYFGAPPFCAPAYEEGLISPFTGSSI